MELAIRENLDDKIVAITDHSESDITRMRVEFVNGYTASIIRGYVDDPFVILLSGGGTYGADEGLYEVAVMRDGFLDYTTPITDDVVGSLDESGVVRVVTQIANLEAPKGLA